jgi:hypothetical protein
VTVVRPQPVVADAATVAKAPVRKAIKALPVKAETPKGYQRDAFVPWIDADGDGQGTPGSTEGG